MKTALVLEGGAMRGLFSAGVMDVMMESGLTFNGIIGTSAGAVFGCNYKSGQAGRVLRYNKRFCRDWRYCSFRSLFLTGDLYGADFAYRRLPSELDPFDVSAFQSSPTAFYVTATDADTGEAVYHQCLTGDHEDIEWMRASASMPMFSRMVQLDGRNLSDGGTADSIPLRYMQSLGYDRCVVVLTQPDGFVKQPNRFIPLMRVALRKYPALVNALAQRHIGYNEALDYIRAEEASGRVLVIRPDAALNIGAICHDPDELERVYRIGQRCAKEKLDELRSFLLSK